MTPFSFWLTGVQTATMLAEAQLVMTLRLAGMAGAIPLPRGEAGRMLSEKVAAVGQAGLAAGQAMAAGKTPNAVAQAALAPVARRTRANAKRLTKAPR